MMSHDEHVITKCYYVTTPRLFYFQKGGYVHVQTFDCHMLPFVPKSLTVYIKINEYCTFRVGGSTLFPTPIETLVYIRTRDTL